tara:strand:- start:1470 stop:2552 length:1083 start_codon:yes stop_codon:yes gene_type:complete
MFGLAILATLVGAVAAVVSSGNGSGSGGGGGSSGGGGAGNSTAGGSNSSTATSGNTLGLNNSSWDVTQDSVPSPGAAQYPKLNEFVSFSLKNEDYTPSYTNLWSFHIATPPILQNVIGFNNAQSDDNLAVTQNSVGQPGGNFVAELGNLRNALNYYCQTVNVPSRQATTGGLVNIGAAQKYATGQAFSQISATFIMPRNQHTRNFFERWLQLMAPDANQYTEFYNFYVSPKISIYKWERKAGGNLPDGFADHVATGGSANTSIAASRLYSLTGCWQLWKAFPYNIGGIQLNNDRARSMTLTVGFYFERYRFFPAQFSKVDEIGPRKDITIPVDSSFNAAVDDASLLQHRIASTVNQLLVT